MTTIIYNNTLSTIFLWKWTLFLRFSKYEFLKTIQGKFIILTTILGTPAIYKILTISVFDKTTLTDDQLKGLLVLGFSMLTLCFIVISACMTAKVFVFKGQSEPLYSHPFCFREIAVYRFVSAFSSVSAFLIFFYLVFYRKLLNSIPYSSILTILFFLLLTLLYFFILMVAVGSWTRSFLLTPRFMNRASVLQRVLVFPFFLSFIFMPGAPMFLQKYSSGWLESIGAHAEQFLWWLQIPLAVLYSITSGDYLSAVVWTAILTTAAMSSYFTVRRWLLSHSSQEIILDFGGETHLSYSNAFSRSLWRQPFARFTHVGIFWIKDVLLPYLRSPSTYIQLHAVLLSGILSCLVMVSLLQRSQPVSFAENGILSAFVILIIAAVFPMMRCLNSLGMEGINICLFRPVLSPWRLFALKLTVNFSYCLLHSIAYSLLVPFLCRSLGLPHLKVTDSLLLAIQGTTLFVGVGMTLGFLFPDMKKKDIFLTGASGLGKNLYLILSAFLITVSLPMFIMHNLGNIPLSRLILFSLLITLPVLICCTVLLQWSMKRLKEMEI